MITPRKRLRIQTPIETAKLRSYFDIICQFSDYKNFLRQKRLRSQTLFVGFSFQTQQISLIMLDLLNFSSVVI